MNEKALKILLLTTIFYMPVLIMFLIRNVNLDGEGAPLQFTFESLLIIVLGYGMEAAAATLAMDDLQESDGFVYICAMLLVPLVFSILVFRARGRGEKPPSA